MSESAAEFLPEDRTLPALQSAALDCRGCGLWEDATQTVFGRGRGTARLMLVGEQPGDREDREGEPFVGPAGRLLRKALREAEIEASEVYLTNAVKHFKWRPRGKRRLHDTPRAGEVTACRPWLEAEIETVGPSGLMALGATAAHALFGASVRVTKDRGKLLESSLAPVTTLTVHPSAILRAGDDVEREEGYAGLVEDLRRFATAVRKS
jgi:uracil-DNA glycosylase family protein